MKKMTFCAPCLFGVEGIVANELRFMDIDNVRAETGRVLFDGDFSTLARANIRLRCAEPLSTANILSCVQLFVTPWTAAHTTRSDEQGQEPPVPVS